MDAKLIDDLETLLRQALNLRNAGLPIKPEQLKELERVREQVEAQS